MEYSVSVPGVPFGLFTQGPSAAASWSVNGESLNMHASAHTDMFVDPARSASGAQLEVLRLVGEVAGDFQLSAQLEVQFKAAFDAGVLFIGVSADTWTKLCFEYTPQGRPSVVSVVTRGDSDDANAYEVEDNRVWFRVSRIGRAFAFHASADGQYWRMIRYFSLGAPSSTPLNVGFLAQSPTGEGCSVTFEHIRFTTTSLTGLRDGS